MNTITVENTQYEFQEVPGKGKCLVPKKAEVIKPKIPVVFGGVYQIHSGLPFIGILVKRNENGQVMFVNIDGFDSQNAVGKVFSHLQDSNVEFLLERSCSKLIADSLKEYYSQR